MRRTPLKRWGRRGPWLPRWREKERKRILAQGGVKTGRKAHRPSKERFPWHGDRPQCIAAMLGGCIGPAIDPEHTFNRQVRGVGGCDCRANVPGRMCRGHHDLKHAMGRVPFYSQHPDLWAMYEVAREHRRLRLLPGSLMPCAPKCTRRP